MELIRPNLSSCYGSHPYLQCLPGCETDTNVDSGEAQSSAQEQLGTRVATYGLPREARVLSIAAAAAEKAARRTFSSETYSPSEPSTRQTLSSAFSTTSTCVQVPAVPCVVITMIRRP